MYRSPSRSGTAIPPSTRGFPSTSAGLVIPQSLSQIPSGKYTTIVYSLIRDEKYQAVIDLFMSDLQTNTENRASNSLLGYCYYKLEDYANAGTWYMF
jgi:hypothetical protein